MIHGVALSLISRVLVIAAGLLTSVLTARALGVVGRGEYFYLVTLANLATQFGNLGLPSSNTYSLAKDPKLLSRLAANSFWISLTLGMAAACTVLLFEADLTARFWIEGPVWLVLLMVPGMLYMVLGTSLLIGLSRIRQYNLFQLGSTAFQLLAIAVAGWMAWGVTAFLSISAFSSMVSAFALFAMLVRLGKLSLRFDVQLFRSQLVYSSKAYLATLFGYGVSRAGVLLMNAFAGKAEVGIYSIAVQFADVLAIVPATVAMVLFPDLLQGVPEKRFSRTMRTTLHVSLIMLALCGITGVAALWIVPLMFGEAFLPAVKVLWWMLPGIFALGIANIVSQYLAAHGIPPANVWTWFGGLLVLLAASRCLIPRWGAVGAAASLSVTYGLVSVTLLFLAVRQYTLEKRASIRREV